MCHSVAASHTYTHQRLVCPCEQDGNYTNIRASLPGWMLQNIPAPAPAAGFTVIPSVDVPFRNYLKSVNGSCSIITTANMSAINNCAVTENSFGYCCYNASGYTVSVQSILVFGTCVR